MGRQPHDQPGIAAGTGTFANLRSRLLGSHADRGRDAAFVGQPGDAALDDSWFQTRSTIAGAERVEQVEYAPLLVPASFVDVPRVGDPGGPDGDGALPGPM